MCKTSITAVKFICLLPGALEVEKIFISTSSTSKTVPNHLADCCEIDVNIKIKFSLIVTFQKLSLQKTTTIGMRYKILTASPDYISLN